MSLGQLALGVASLVMGVHHLSNGAKRLRGNGRRKHPQQKSLNGLRGASLKQAFMDSGQHMVQLPNGTRVPMRMRTFNIKTLDDRIRYLNDLVNEGKRDPQVFAFARRAITQKCGDAWCIPEKDNLGEARAIFNSLKKTIPPQMTARDLMAAKRLFKAVRKNVRYTSDISGVDTYQKPSHTLALKTADCDDGSSLICSALGSIGIPCRFKVIRTKGAPTWNHIYPQAGFPRSNPKRWVSMDSSVDMPFGWEAPPKMVADSRVFSVR